MADKWYRKVNQIALGYAWGITTCIWILFWFHVETRIAYDLLIVQWCAVAATFVMLFLESRNLRRETRKAQEEWQRQMDNSGFMRRL